MSDGLARVAGGGVPIEFDGETLILPSLTLRDFATLEQHLLAKRENPLDVVREKMAGLSLEVQKHLIDVAYADMRRNTTVSPEEVDAYMGTTEGLAFTIWLALSRGYPGRWTLEQIENKINDMDVKSVHKMLRARDQAAGIDELGNSTGQVQTEPRNLAEKNGTAAVRVNGDGSREKSAKLTGTRRSK